MYITCALVSHYAAHLVNGDDNPMPLKLVNYVYIYNLSMAA